MTTHFFAIGDIHGKFGLLQDLLKKWNSSSQQLVFIGDLIDRGEDSKACLELVCRLVRSTVVSCMA